MTTFTGNHFRQLQEALVEAFPEPARLKELCQFALGRNLARVTTGGSLDGQAFDLIGHAQATGSLDELIKGAWELNPGNPLLRDFLNGLAPGWCFNLPESTLDTRCLPMGYRIQKWKVLRRLGAGGMGTVYAVSAGYSEFALKVLHAVVEPDEDQGAFEREVGRIVSRTARVLTDGIVKVHEGGVDAPLRAPWILMDLVKGESLRVHVERSGRLKVSEVREVADQLYDTLADLHGVAGDMIHCDIKPENVFVHTTRRGRQLKVLDLGFDRLVQEGGPHYGTPLYAPPELWEGATATPATDVWSSALLVFYLLTGSEFWRSRYADQLMVEICESPHRAASERARELGVTLPREFDEWFARCIVVDPSRRIASMDEAGSLLRKCLSSWSGSDKSADVSAPERLPPREPIPEGANLPRREAPGSLRLTTWLKERGPLHPLDALWVVSDVGDALRILRSIPGVYATLEPARIVLEAADDGSVRQARVVDIEASAVVGGRTTKGQTVTLRLDQLTIGYTSPTIMFCDGLPVPDDVWSIAMIVYEMLTGQAFVQGLDARTWARLSMMHPKATERAKAQGVELRLPQEFDVWFARCLSAEAEQKIPDVMAAWRLLRPIFASPGASRSAVASGAVEKVDEEDLYRRLRQLLPSQFDEVIEIKMKLPSHHLPGHTAPPAERALAAIKLCKNADRLTELLVAVGHVSRGD